MNSHITYSQVIRALDENRAAYGLLPLQNNVSLVITRRGGRVLGPFLSPASESLFWINPAFASPEAFRAFLAAGGTNLGGERLWITPEIQYHVQDRTRMGDTYILPPEIDPGHYTLEQTRPDEWRLEQNMRLEAYNTASGIKELHLQVTIHPAADPLRYTTHYAELLDGITFAGYEQVVKLSETKRDAIMSEAWNLIQINPGGDILIPASPHTGWRDYYEPAENGQEIHADHIRVHITGQRRYKLGYQAVHTFGRLAYFNTLDGDQAYLIVRNFFNNPSAPYIEEAASAPWTWGDAIHIYNDSGSLGGFGELEVHGQTIGGETRRSASQDQMVLWFYAGPTIQIHKLIPHLLGITIG